MVYGLVVQSLRSHSWKTDSAEKVESLSLAESQADLSDSRMLAHAFMYPTVMCGSQVATAHAK